MQTQKADYCIISSEEATLFIPILGAKPKLTGFTTHCIGTGQKKEKRDWKLFYTRCQADTEHLKMAIVHLSEDTRVDSLLLKDGCSSQLQFRRPLKKVEWHNSSVKLNHTHVHEPPLWCESSSARLVWRFLHYRNPNLLPQHKSLLKSNRQMPPHVTLSQASLPALLNRAAPAGPVPNLSMSVFQQIIGSKGREVSLLFLPVCLNLYSLFSNLPSLIPYLLKYAV